jgi:nonsense-mediated mRNA decay protein 3
VKLVDAGFIWTEPHSKRLKVKLTIQSEVFNGTILQQGFVVEFVVENHMCLECNRNNANPNSWTACVQVREGVAEVFPAGRTVSMMDHSLGSCGGWRTAL